MYLKALELQGFKSFPEKTRITFERSVTAIVGPNGSGKSNISDALLWVMGEQRTRTLRGGKMEDVIFGGTEKRSPMGFAQVTLVLDNTARTFPRDCDEISISRRYYRSGESEYAINKESVRLRDVTDLLMDTGLGRDGYSVIGQNRITEIVSARSTDRREIFEEAAGISRFRYRKEESERKLQKTEENLLRIGDKIAELELHLEPLREQAETAKKYLLLRDELRIKEISLWMENLDRLHQQSEGLRQDYEEAVKARDTAKGELESLYAAAESLSEEMRRNDLAIERQRERQREEESGAAELESGAAVLRSNIRNNAETMERLQREMEDQRSRSDQLLRQIEAQQAQLTALLGEEQELRGREAGLMSAANDASLGLRQHGDRLNALLLRENGYSAELAENATAESLLRENLASFEERRTAVHGELREAGERLQGAGESVQREEKALTEAAEQVTRTGNMVSGRQMLLQNRERSCAELAEEREKLSSGLRWIDSRLSLLQEMEKEYEGFNKAVKTVMRESERGALRGVHGPVARLISTEDRTALAVETALGGSAQHIVVDSQSVGKSAIEMLQRRGAGRGTFLPLDTIRPSSLGQRLDGEEGFVALCDELVDCEERYRAVISNLLGRTVVTETLSDALRIARKTRNAFRIVTLDGQMVNVGGSMTGGSSAKNTGILSRAHELLHLTEQRQEGEEKLKKVAADAREAERKREELRLELENAREDNVAAREEQRRREGSLSQAKLLHKAAQEALDSLREEQDSLEGRKQSCEERIGALLERRRELEDALAALREEIEKENRSGEEVEQARRGLEEQLGALRERRAAVESEQRSTERSVEQLRSLRQDMLERSGGQNDALTLAKERGEQFERELAEREEQLKARRQHIEELQREGKTLGERRLELEARRVSGDRAAQEKNKELLELERSCARLEQRKQAADLEESQIVDKLWDNYELSRSAAQSLRQPIESYSKISRQVSELRKSINALGNPNVGAIDEYARLSERYDFLTAQRSDVEKSKAEIEGIIRDITAQMETIFVEQFRKIDVCFRETFLQLFGGGKASLSLEDPEHVLDCGIDIRIQPPGKALSNISLLSGGEKSFVAIALYFAIMKVRPTPFCVMDEIESALDEANVNIVADYLHTMSEKTQFIVITHRRGSMESADALYGVTMQEKGVSTVLSLDMDEAMKNIQGTE